MFQAKVLANRRRHVLVLLDALMQVPAPFNSKSNRPFRPRFTGDFQIVHVICQIHLPYRGYFCPGRLLCKPSNEKRSEICIREQFVTRMVRYGGEIENCDFDKEKDAKGWTFWYVFFVTVKSYWCLEEFWREVPKLGIYSK